MHPDYPVLKVWEREVTQTAGELTPLVVGEHLPEHTRAVVLGWKGPPSWEQWDGQATNDMLVDLRLSSKQVQYRRVFLLARHRTVEIPVGAHQQITVLMSVTPSALGTLPVRGQVMASCERANPVRREPLVFVQEVTSTSEFAVPLGARRVSTPVADPGFSWRARAAIILADPLPAVTWREVAGTRFALGSAPRVLSWEIEL